MICLLFHSLLSCNVLFSIQFRYTSMLVDYVVFDRLIYDLMIKNAGKI